MFSKKKLENILLQIFSSVNKTCTSENEILDFQHSIDTASVINITYG